jgi:hypothetical protein
MLAESCPYFLEQMLVEERQERSSISQLTPPGSPRTEPRGRMSTDDDTEIEGKVYPINLNLDTITPSMSASLARRPNRRALRSDSPVRSAPSGDGGSIMREMAINTALTSKSMKKAFKGSPINTRLNLATTTPKNFTRFVTRIGTRSDCLTNAGDLVSLQEEIIEIFSWENPSRTVAFMLGYILLCLFPVLCLILPQSLFLYYLARQYYLKAKRHTGFDQAKINPSLQYLKNMQFSMYI